MALVALTVNDGQLVLAPQKPTRSGLLANAAFCQNVASLISYVQSNTKVNKHMINQAELALAEDGVADVPNLNEFIERLERIVNPDPDDPTAPNDPYVVLFDQELRTPGLVAILTNTFSTQANAAGQAQRMTATNARLDLEAGIVPKSMKGKTAAPWAPPSEYAGFFKGVGVPVTAITGGLKTSVRQDQ